MCGLWFTMENGGRFLMAAAIGLRADFTADDLRRLAKAHDDAGQTRRLLALAAIYAGRCGPLRPGSAGSICRRFGLKDRETVQWTVSPTNGFCASTLTVLGVLSTGNRPSGSNVGFSIAASVKAFLVTSCHILSARRSALADVAARGSCFSSRSARGRLMMG